MPEHDPLDDPFYIPNTVYTPTPQWWEMVATARWLPTPLRWADLEQPKKETDNMATEREYVLKKDGSLSRRTITEVELDVSEEFVRRISQNVTMKLPNFMEMPGYGNLGFAVDTAGSMYFTVPLQRMIIRAPWHLIKEQGILVPMFGNKADPLITIPWDVPSGMALNLMVSVGKSMERGAMPFATYGLWLFAMSSDKATWRLPIANVHDDCSCCTGQTVYGKTILGTLNAGIKNFESSSYNADLWKDALLTHRCFRLKPLSGDKFETLPPEAANWTELCIRVGTEVTNYLA